MRIIIEVLGIITIVGLSVFLYYSFLCYQDEVETNNDLRESLQHYLSLPSQLREAKEVAQAKQVQIDKLIAAWPSWGNIGSVYERIKGRGLWAVTGQSGEHASREEAVMAAAGIEAEEVIQEESR